MKFIIAFTAVLIAVCVAAPAGDEVRATVLSDDRDNNGVDNYHFNFETSNGIQRQEVGELKQVDENAAIVVRGSVSWTSPEGQLIELKYTADENGYHPVL